MTPRTDFGATDIARENADVFITAGRWLSRLLLPTALICLAVASAAGLHDHVVITPSLWFHHLGAGGAPGSLGHLIVLLAITFFGVTLQSLVLGPDAFARGEPAAVIATLRATARRFFHEARRASLPVVGSTAARSANRVANDPDNGILRQLRSALSIAPVGPPARLTFSSDPSGPYAQSDQRVEVCVAA